MEKKLYVVPEHSIEDIDMALCGGTLGSICQSLTVDQIKKGGCKAMLDLCEGIAEKFGITNFDLYLDKHFTDDEEIEFDIFPTGFSLYYSLALFLNTHIPMLDQNPFITWDICNPKWSKTLNLLNHAINYFRSCDKDLLSWKPLEDKNKALKSNRDSDLEEVTKIGEESKILKMFCSAKRLEQKEIENSNDKRSKIFNQRLNDVKALKKQKDDYEIGETVVNEEIKKAEDFLKSLGKNIKVETEKVVNSPDSLVKKRKENEEQLNDLSIQLSELVSKKAANKLNCGLSEKAAQAAEEQISVLENRLNLFTIKVLEDDLKKLSEINSDAKDVEFKSLRNNHMNNCLNTELKMFGKEFDINKKNVKLINYNLSELLKTYDKEDKKLAFFTQEIITKLQKLVYEINATKEYRTVLEESHKENKDYSKDLLESVDETLNFYLNF